MTAHRAGPHRSDLDTLPNRLESLPVRTLHVAVIDGPDRGAAHTAGCDAVGVGTAASNELVLRDPTVSRFHVELRASDEGIWVIDPGSTNGTFAGGIRIERAVVPPGSVLRLGKTGLRVSEGDAVSVDLHDGTDLAGLRGRTPVMRRLMAQIARAARSDVSILISGESGTGKERIAHGIHELSTRAANPLVTVDCGALSKTLVASELFGHERGAFTGAEALHRGAFERAIGGTLFLDEIGELPAELQPTLLGVLERKRFRRLGGSSDIPADVRVISATNRDLRAEMNAGRFRLDLFYRLAVVRLDVPPLRERTGDIPLLVQHFVRECGYAEGAERVLTPEVTDALAKHPWPGNVRELRNFVEATLALGDPVPLGASAKGAEEDDAGKEEAWIELPYREARGRVLERFEVKYLTRLMARSGGNVRQAARIARADRSHLIELLRRHKIR